MPQVSHDAVPDDDRDHVEAELRRTPALTLQVLEGELPDAPALVDGDGFLGEAEGRGRPRLDLAEDEGGTVFADDVELSAPDAAVAVEDPVSELLESGAGGLFAQAPRDLPCPRHARHRTGRYPQG